MKTISVRKALSSEIEWINKTYKSIGFVTSSFDIEYIAVAETKGLICGLGRVVDIDPKNSELGGMYVFEQFQGLGIAKKIISHLLDHFNSNKKLWCLPFEHLEHFYKKFGFIDQAVANYNIPEKIHSKYKWCNLNYDKNVLLLVK